MLKKLAKVLGVSESYLLTGKEIAPQSRTAAQVIRAAAEEIAALNGVPVSKVHIDWRIGNRAGIRRWGMAMHIEISTIAQIIGATGAAAAAVLTALAKFLPVWRATGQGGETQLTQPPANGS